MKKNKLANSYLGGGGNLRNKAFTLIELLAIIVILAIIAVITIPIILNVIENSRRGAAIDSAYGYKDAIEKYYVTELSRDTDFKLGGDYTIEEKGTLKSITNTTEKIHEISILGTIPSGGNIEIINNVVTNGCMTIGDYKITLQNGKVTTTEKGECVVSAKPSPIEWFTFEEETGTLTGLSEYWISLTDEDKYNIVIPEKTPVGNEILNIRNGAFQNKNLKSVILNKNLKTIGHAAFSGNQLEYIDLGYNIESIGIQAFYHNNLKSIKIPDMVVTIGHDAFRNNEIEIVEIGVGLREIESGVFGNNNIKNIIIPDNIEKIGVGAFSVNEIENIEIGINVENIGEGAFAYNNLTTVTIPSNVKIMGESVFTNNDKLTEIIVKGIESKPDGWDDKWNNGTSAIVHWNKTVE